MSGKKGNAREPDGAASRTLRAQDEAGSGRGGEGPDRPAAVEILDGEGSSLLDAVDKLLDQGVLLEGDLVLGLADVDLIYLKLSTLLAAADRILGKSAHLPPAEPPGAGPPPEPETEDVGCGLPHQDETSAPRPTVRQAAPYDSDRPSAGVGAELDSARAEGARPGEPHLRTADLDTLRSDLERGLQGEAPEASTPATPPRWNAAPEDVERSVARLVLALVEFLRKLMERQAIRRMEEDTLAEAEVERLGRALMRLEETVHDLARRFGLTPEELNLDLGPLGRLT